MAVYEAWDDPDDNAVMCGTTASVEESRSKGLLSENARLLYRFTAATHEEAQSIHSLRMGWGPYQPHGDPSKCPVCDAWYYAEGSGECWQCLPAAGALN